MEDLQEKKRIPHDEKHRFLVWGPEDHAFRGWIDFFNSKGVHFEVGYRDGEYTIYKHMLYTSLATGAIHPCCTEVDEDY